MAALHRRPIHARDKHTPVHENYPNTNYYSFLAHSPARVTVSRVSTHTYTLHHQLFKYLHTPNTNYTLKYRITITYLAFIEDFVPVFLNTRTQLRVVCNDLF